MDSSAFNGLGSSILLMGIAIGVVIAVVIAGVVLLVYWIASHLTWV